MPEALPGLSTTYDSKIGGKRYSVSHDLRRPCGAKGLPLPQLRPGFPRRLPHLVHTHGDQQQPGDQRRLVAQGIRHETLADVRAQPQRGKA